MTGEDDGLEPTFDVRGGDGDGDGVTPPADALFELLSNAARRRTLWYLLENPQTTLEEVADVLAGWMAGDGGPVGPTEREAIESGLHHLHLPALAEAGLVVYDAETGRIDRPQLGGRTRDAIRLAHRYDLVDRSGADGGDPDSESDVHGDGDE
jgi:hypothetical protein